MNRMSLFASLLTIFCAAVLCSCANSANLQADETKPPEVGKKAPDFELSTLEEKAHKLSELVKQGPVVVVMLRGYPTYQCPVCSKQMASFLNSAKQFDKLETTVVFVYPDKADGVAEHSQEFIKDKKFPGHFLFLLDPDFKFTESYGLRWNGAKETAYPATFIIDENQKVKFAKISRTHGGRTKPQEILDELQKK